MELETQADNSLILVVDDDPTVRLLVRATLEKAGFQIEEAENGEEALTKFIKHQPAVILMDVEMPKLDGYEACRRIRDDAVGMHVPILMVTGLEDVNSVDQAYAAGATDFIAKPINWSLLGHRVRYVLRAGRTYTDLRASEAKNDALLNAMPDTLLVIKRNGLIVNFLAGSGSTTLPEPRGDQARISDYLPKAVAADWQNLIQLVIAEGKSQHLEFRLGDDTEPNHYELQIVPYLNDLTLAIVRDITNRKRSEEKVYRLAYYDALTGLPNRQLFKQRLADAITRANEQNSKVAALYIDLDNFKRINDTLGHDYGDTILKTIAERLDNCLRAEDCVSRQKSETKDLRLARLGGDEFVAIIQNLDGEENAVAVTERIRSELSRSIKHLDHEIVVTSSIGVSLFPDDGADFESLLKNADIAMYQAKNSGRNSVRFYSGTMSLQSLERLQLENDLRYALQRDELEIYYQPQIDLTNDTMTGAEALLRWHHPDHGMIPPARFIPLAEECGLIAPLGEWVLQRACHQLKIWRDKYESKMTVAVNLSSQQFFHCDVADVVLKAIFDASLEPSAVHLELTESILMNDLEQTAITLARLKDAGVSLAMDDFGTGYSSLSYLKSLPLDILKIDRSFVKDIESAQDNAAICSAIIAMAHNLKLHVIAEGVETPEQLEYMRFHGCDQVQGFLISKPVPADELEERFLKKSYAKIYADQT